MMRVNGFDILWRMFTTNFGLELGRTYFKARQSPRTVTPKKMEPDFAVATNIDVRPLQIKILNSKIFRPHANAIIGASKISEFISLILLFANIATATTIVAAITQRDAVIGVDGEATRRPNGVAQHFRACKAIETGGALYVGAGLVPSGIRQDVLRIKSPTDIRSIQATHDSIKLKLQAEIPSIEQEDPIRYSEILTRTNPVFKIYTAWPEGHTVAIRITSFNLSRDNKTITVDSKMVTNDRLSCDCMKDATFPTPPPNWVASDHVALVKNALATLLPKDNPATIVNITSNRIEWQEQGACEADGSNAWQEPK